MFVILIFNMAITLPGSAFTAISMHMNDLFFPRRWNLKIYSSFSHACNDFVTRAVIR